MKKVININFQGRVIPIEETAYEILQRYVDSLRKYFANEEGKDEIINDIEGRIAELFSDKLKKGATCITDADVNAVMASIGRPEDFEKAEDSMNSGARTQTSAEASQPAYTYVSTGRGRLYRNADDKIIAGVCSGLGNYLGIDPVFVRILFVVFIGALFWVYIILWIIVPSQSITSNITKRLYRSPDDKVIGGVCGGLAAYFNIQNWIPRLIFALPLIIALVSGPFNIWLNHWEFWMAPKIVTGSLGFTLFITYVILWIAVPVATTSSEKLEMRGEKVDLNSIRNTVKEDMESFKAKAQNFGNEVKEVAQNFGERAKAMGQTAGTQAKAFTAEARPVVRRTGGGLGHVIGILFKAFFLIIAGSIAIFLFGLLLTILFGGFIAFPFKDFILEGFWQNMLAWLSLLLFLGIPIVALIVWLIRRIMGVRSRNHYLGYVFGSLWTIGLVSFIILLGLFARNFKSGSEKLQDFTGFVQPAKGKLLVDVATSNVRYYGGDWFGFNEEDFPVYGVNQDTLMLNTVRVNIVKSQDSLFHVRNIKFARGRNPETSVVAADKIQFDIQQRDSVLILPKGFPISKQDKFRTQRVLVVIEVPLGRKIQLDRSLYGYKWFTVDFDRHRGWDANWDDNWDRNYGWEPGVEYIMTNDGLKRTDEPVDAVNEEGDNNSNRENQKTKTPSRKDDYRYKEKGKSPKANPDSTQEEKTTGGEEATDQSESYPSLIYMLVKMAR
jgi:phage shock protein PspC (stress-responsive transcriptional regulator)